MANSWFQFKQFRVQQGRCAMKVCTEACILGAWAQPGTASRMLDIGSGTGLLSLMLAQRSQAPLDAVEIDEDACAQTYQNFSASAWASRLTVYKQPVQEFALQHAGQYDFIICNPPFYDSHPQRKTEAENAAMHQSALSFPELASAVKTLLAPDGKFAVLLPEPQSISFERQAEKNGLNIERQLFIFNTLPGRVFRIITLYSRSEPDGFELEELAIRDKDGNYTKHFTELLQPYYLFGETPEAYLPE